MGKFLRKFSGKFYNEYIKRIFIKHIIGDDTHWVKIWDNFEDCGEGDAQWEHFIQKGGQKFFLFKFLIFRVEIIFSRILWDPRRFFGEIRTGHFVGKIQATTLSSLHGKYYAYPKWCAIAICCFHQLLVWSSEISLRCIRHFSSDPLPFSTPKRLKSSKKKACHQRFENFVRMGCPRVRMGCPRVPDFFSLESRDLGL